MQPGEHASWDKLDLTARNTGHSCQSPARHQNGQGATILTLCAKAAPVVWTFSDFCLGVNVKVEALISAGAEPVLSKESAFWHTSQIVFVQVIACIALFTQTAKPMLADGTFVRIANGYGGREEVERGGRDVAEGASSAEWAETAKCELAYLRVGLEFEWQVGLDVGLEGEYVVVPVAVQ